MVRKLKWRPAKRKVKKKRARKRARKKRVKPKCTVVDADGQCKNAAKSRGMCQKHYMRWRAHGSPTVKLKTGPRTPRINEKAIGDILDARARRETLASIGRRYGVSRQRIWELVNKHQPNCPKRKDL